MISYFPLCLTQRVARCTCLLLPPLFFFFYQAHVLASKPKPVTQPVLFQLCKTSAFKALYLNPCIKGLPEADMTTLFVGRSIPFSLGSQCSSALWFCPENSILEIPPCQCTELARSLFHSCIIFHCLNEQGLLNQSPLCARVGCYLHLVIINTAAVDPIVCMHVCVFCILEESLQNTSLELGLVDEKKKKKEINNSCVKCCQISLHKDYIPLVIGEKACLLRTFPECIM